VVSTTIANDLKDRIRELNVEQSFAITERLITHSNGNQILFKGLKAQTNTTDANNKGINNYKVAILDEAQDLTKEADFDRFNLSIRSADEKEKSLVILVLNPTNKEHWIYKRFFEKRGIADGFNGVQRDVLYIHTTYLDAMDIGVPVDKKIINEGEELKNDDYDRYSNIFLGHWAEVSNFLIFPRVHLTYANELPQEFEYKYGYIDVADEGNDYLAFVMCGIKEGKAYLFYVYYTKASIDVTLPKVVELIQHHNLDMVRIEANNMGKGFYRQVKSELEQTNCTTQLLTVTNTTNKIVRIVNESYTIKKRFVFLERSKQDKMYFEFMEHLHKVCSDSKNEVDDGADALAGLNRLITTTYYKYATT